MPTGPGFVKKWHLLSLNAAETGRFAAEPVGGAGAVNAFGVTGPVSMALVELNE